MESISLRQARNLILSSQKLSGTALSPQEIIEHLGYVQIDTISVVERAHHHVFWSRNEKYRPRHLDQLVKDRKVFEYWSHAASYLPMSDYRYTLPMKRAFRSRTNSWFPRDPKLMSAVLKRIKNEGPLRSKDFENVKKGKTGWWDWKPAKKALERLFMEGRLEITHREGFQKVYDLPENVIPSSVDTSYPTKSEYTRHLIFRTLRHHGLATASEIAYLRKKDIKDKVSKQMKSMLSQGELIEVDIEGIQESYFAFPETLQAFKNPKPKLWILSPFDNFIIQRKKLKNFFNFDYQIECYVPEAKRKYGYFTLPVFYGSQAIGRLDCKADRKLKQMRINSAYFEKGIDSGEWNSKIEKRLNSFTRFNGCDRLFFHFQ